MSVTDQTLFGFVEAAKRWGVSVDTLRRASVAGDLKTIQLAGRRLIPLDEVLRVETAGFGKGRKKQK